jgi:hypothetical protein
MPININVNQLQGQSITTLNLTHTSQKTIVIKWPHRDHPHCLKNVDPACSNKIHDLKC